MKKEMLIERQLKKEFNEHPLIIIFIVIFVFILFLSIVIGIFGSDGSKNENSSKSTDPPNSQINPKKEVEITPPIIPNNETEVTQEIETTTDETEVTQEIETTTNETTAVGNLCGVDTYNCVDFSSCSEVMNIFNNCSYDVNKLDRDEDGIPCESLCDGG